MKVTVLPLNGAFVNQVLVMNLSNNIFKKQDLFLKRDVDLAIIINNKYSIGLNLTNNSVIVYDTEINDFYGPYASYKDAIAKHLFGVVDGLFYLFSKVKFNKTIGSYEFEFGDFVYNLYTNRFTSSLKETVLLLKKTLKVVNKPFVFTLEPETSFGKNVITNYLIELNNTFSIYNFPDFLKKTELGIIGRVDKLKHTAVNYNGNPFAVFNFQNHRHILFFVPNYIYPNYFTYIDNTDKEEDFNAVFKTGKTETKSNIEWVQNAKKMYNIDITKMEVTLDKLQIIENLKFITTKDSAHIVYYFIVVNENPYYLEADYINKTFTMYPFSEMVIEGQEIKFTNGGYGINTDGKEHIDLVYKKDNKVFDFDFDIKLIKSLEEDQPSYYMDIEYFSNIVI